MNYKIAATGLFVLTLTTCSSPAGASSRVDQTAVDLKSTSVVSILNSTPQQTTLLGKQYVRNQMLMDNGAKLNAVVDKLKARVGKTWYVFSGNTPAGWDCSGLTMWFYEIQNLET
jgi:cell wall-associated NlpC family hydrolase